MPEAPKDAKPFKLIVYAREQKGLSLNDLAKISGLPYGVIYNLENGNNPIHYEEAFKLGAALDIEPDKLLDEYARFTGPGYGERIRIIRLSCNATQEEFAEKLGITRSTLSVWEAEINNRRPGRKAYERLKSIATSVDICIDRLIDGQEFFEDEYSTFLQGDYGKKIKYIRAAYDVTQAEFAKMVGLSGNSSSCNWESMTEKPLRKTFSRIKFLAEAKGIELKRLNENPDYYRDEYSRFIERDSGLKIRYVRLKYGSYTDAFGRMLGCSGNAVCTWERGQCVMGRQYFDAFKALAEAKGLCLEELNENPTLYEDEYDDFCAPGCGYKIQYIRSYCGLTVEEFAKLLNVGVPTVGSWEHDRVQRGSMKRPGRESFEKIKQVALEHGLNLKTVAEELSKRDTYRDFCQEGFGKKFMMVRNAYGVSKAEFADMISASPGSIGRWECEGKVRGKTSYPTRERYLALKALAEEKGVNIDEPC